MAVDSDARTQEKTAADALRHPFRVRILEVLNERDMSATLFTNAGYVGEPTEDLVSKVAYHFRALAKAEAIIEINQERKRGAIETTYRGAARAYWGDEEWSKIPHAERKAISRVMYQGLFARVEGALIEGTFDARDDRWLVWRAMSFDTKGWSDFSDALHRVDKEVVAIQQDSESRLAETGEDPIPTTFGLLGFESPGA